MGKIRHLYLTCFLKFNIDISVKNIQTMANVVVFKYRYLVSIVCTLTVRKSFHLNFELLSNWLVVYQQIYSLITKII